VKGFQKLRQEQHAMSEKVSEIRSQISEHKSVIAALEKSKMTSAGKTAGSSSQQAGGSNSGPGGLTKPTPKQEEIVKGFQKLRQEQHAMSEKVSEIRSQISEHKSVIAALEKVTEDRTCYRMVEQALVERKVADVLPELRLMKTNLENTVNMMQQQIEKKGAEIVEYKSKHDIRIQGEQS